MRSREQLAWTAAALVLGVGVRLWFVTDVHPPGAHVASDMWVYDFRARRLLNGPLDAWDTFTPVGYPALLALLYSVAGAHGHVAAGVAQAVFGGATAALTHRIGRRLATGRVVAPIAGLVVALHFPLVFYAGFLLTEVSFAFLLTLSVWLLLRAAERPGLLRASLAGLVVGAATVLRPNLLAAYPFVALYLVLTVGRARHAWRPLVAGLALGALVPLVAAGLHNSRIAQRPVVLATNGGLNFFANFAEVRSIKHRDARGVVHTITPIPNLLFHRQDFDSPRPFHDAGWFYGQGLERIRERPDRLLRALRNLPEGMGLGLQDYWPGWRGHERLLDAYSLGFGWLGVVPALLGIAALVLGGRLRDEREGPTVLLAGVVLSAFLVLYLFLGDPRVRVPFDPLIVLLALDATVRAVKAVVVRAPWRSAAIVLFCHT